MTQGPTVPPQQPSSNGELVIEPRFTGRISRQFDLSGRAGCFPCPRPSMAERSMTCASS